MAENFVELGAEGVNHLTEKYFDSAYDKVTGKKNKRDSPQAPRDQEASRDQATYTAQGPAYTQEPASAVSGTSRRKQKNRLPSPEDDGRGKENYRDRRRDSQRSASLDRESQYSARVVREYNDTEAARSPESVLSRKDLKKLRGDQKMSYANGYANTSLQTPGYDNRRAASQQAPRSRYDDDDSDYDERSGRRYKSSGRGYDDYDDDRGYDREIIETERYRGPPRRESYGASRGYNNDSYGAGAVTRYNKRSTQDVDEYRNRDSRSRGRRDRDRSRSRSYSGSRSRSRSRSAEGIRGKIDETFDTSMRGLGVGIAGAVVGGLAGREFGDKHRQRDIIVGALVGGLGANAAENKWRDWKDNKERDLRRDEEKFEQKWDGGYGRSRSAMR